MSANITEDQLKQLATTVVEMVKDGLSDLIKDAVKEALEEQEEATDVDEGDEGDVDDEDDEEVDDEVEGDEEDEDEDEDIGGEANHAVQLPDYDPTDPAQSFNWPPVDQVPFDFTDDKEKKLYAHLVERAKRYETAVETYKTLHHKNYPGTVFASLLAATHDRRILHVYKQLYPDHRGSDPRSLKDGYFRNKPAGIRNSLFNIFEKHLGVDRQAWGPRTFWIPIHDGLQGKRIKFSKEDAPEPKRKRGKKDAAKNPASKKKRSSKKKAATASAEAPAAEEDLSAAGEELPATEERVAAGKEELPTTEVLPPAPGGEPMDMS